MTLAGLIFNISFYYLQVTSIFRVVMGNVSVHRRTLKFQMLKRTTNGIY